MFREKLANYVIRTLTHPDDVVKIVRKMEDPATGFEKEHMPKDLTDEEREARRIMGAGESQACNCRH